ncbi:MAG: hypothetical protein AAF927_13675 [Bacteroidota bacterium]
MNPKALFSIMILPQSYEAGNLNFNLVLLPRNISPLLALSGYQHIPGPNFPKPFVEVGTDLNLVLKYIPDLSSLPENANATTSIGLNLAVPQTAEKIYLHFKGQFNINDIASSAQRAPSPDPSRFTLKSLPKSYCNAFNFTNPRVKEAVIDDSYRCAFKGDKYNKTFKTSPDQISWGKVYAYCLRNPILAQKAGLIYPDLSVAIPQADLQQGAWVYIDFDTSGYFAQEAQTTPALVHRYAARIPAIEPDTARPLFAPVLFPVTFGTALSGIYDEQQRDAADYDDGFAKILHGFQPISTSPLEEEVSENSLPPVKDIGIRLAWDDEQVLIWLNRQMRTDPNSPEIFPMGVTNYKIDVREPVEEGLPENEWNSLNLVKAKDQLIIDEVEIMAQDQEVELGTDVYPNQIDGNTGRNYWLPLYFTQWTGKSLAIPDQEAQEIYRVSEEIRTYETNNQGRIGLSASGEPLKPTPANPYEAVATLPLIYGRKYEFRARMGDISGGGPTTASDRLYEAISQNDVIPFKRYVAPNEMRLRHLPADDDPSTADIFTEEKLTLRRPLIEYPNVVFTNAYPKPVPLLKEYSAWMVQQFGSNPQTYKAWQKARQKVGISGTLGYGLPDPDVNQVEIVIELKSLQMDNSLSVNKRDSFIKLYSVKRPLEALKLEEPLDTSDPLDPFKLIERPTEIALEYRDAKVLNFGDPADFGDLNTTQAILDDPATPIILPTARDIRMTIRPLGAEDPVYYGNEAWRKGKVIQFMLRQASDNETSLYDPAFSTDWLEGVYLQPEIEINERGQTPTQILMGGRTSEIKPPSLVGRLAQSLNLAHKKSSLIANPGERVQFGCARAIRHSLSPDGTSLTFATKTDLLNHWLVTLNVRLMRDWTWNPLKLRAFLVKRRKKFGRETNWGSQEVVGRIDLQRGINLQALDKANRSFTQLVFIDAVEPKPDPDSTAFPDIIELEYFLEPQFKDGEVPFAPDGELKLDLRLPVTTNPAQVPVLASAGIALSPYRRDERYANTEARERHLWIELEEAVEDPNDELFIRFLAYSPDPLLVAGNRLADLLEAPKDPEFPIDPEWIRVIRPDQADDNAGLNAMVELSPAIVESGDKARHFLVPIPPGLHANADELFGFFTYELRIGHKHIWSTSQGRFGRPLRVTGVQHPAPTLFCVSTRDSNQIRVSAPYAAAVHEGKNITATPPKTEIWCLLYAQVKRADNLDYRNILLGERKLKLSTQNDKIGFMAGNIQETSLANLDRKQVATTVLDQAEIELALSRLGLPLSSPLSILCVEFLPTRPVLDFTRRQKPTNIIGGNTIYSNEAITYASAYDPRFANTRGNAPRPTGAETGPRPLSRDLGHYRILRTSPLTAVGDIC